MNCERLRNVFVSTVAKRPPNFLIAMVPTDQTIDVIVPAYREALNLELLIGRLEQLRKKGGLALRLTIVDDNSQDGTDEVIQKINADWVRLITRKNDRGLSSAVLDGIRQTSGDIIVVMDADLSHPPEVLPAMLDKLASDSDFVVGSRYVEGGGTDDDWGILRWLNSRVATFLARPFTSIKDPMGGFFALRRETYNQADCLNPVGYKIGLELMVKCHCKHIAEIPIKFANRVYGESKLNLKEQLRYIQHIRRLFLHKYGTWSEILQFLVVGASGVVVNLLTLTLMLLMGVGANASIGLAIIISIVTNFLLNRRFTFSHAKNEYLPTQFIRYLASVSFGSVVNYVVAVLLLQASPSLIPQLASLMGIACATIVNFVTLKFLVFKKKFYKAQEKPLPNGRKPDRQTESLQEWHPLLSLVLILAVFFFFATRFAINQSLWTDETTQLSGLTLSFADNLRWLTGSMANPFPFPSDRMPPISYWIGKLWQLLVGTEVLTMRYLSIVASAGAVITVWFAGRRFFSPLTGFFAALLLAASPNIIVQSVEIRAYSLFIFFSSLTLYFYLKAAALLHMPQFKRGLWPFVVAALCCSFTHFFGVVVAAGGYASLILLTQNKVANRSERLQQLRPFLAPGLTYLFFLFLLLPFVFAAVEVSGQASLPDGAFTFQTKEYAHDLVRMLYRFFAHQTMLEVPGLNVIIPILGLALTALAWRVNISQRARQLVLFLVVTVIFVASAGLVVNSFNVFSPSYNAWALPVVSLMMASTMAHPMSKWRKIALISLVVIGAGNLYGTIQLSNHGMQYAHCRAEDLRKILKNLGAEDTTVIFVNQSAHTYFPLMYYYGSKLNIYEIDGNKLRSITPDKLGQRSNFSDLRTKNLILAASEQLSAKELQNHLKFSTGPTLAKQMLSQFEASVVETLDARWQLIQRHNLLAQSGLSLAVYKACGSSQ